ncbi:MAG: hypothetical protein M3416_01370 [Acidobacteriota bacterium]|nr:hypothetical protein [Acidobacteriota bacterium]
MPTTAKRPKKRGRKAKLRVPAHGGGRPPNEVLAGSVLRTFKEFERLDPERPLRHLVMDAVTLLAPEHAPLRKVLRQWEKLHSRDQQRPLAIDECVLAAGMKAEEFKGLVGGHLRGVARERIDNMIAAQLPELVEVSLEEAKKPENFKERSRHFESRGIFLPPPGQSTTVNNFVNAQAQSGERQPPPAVEGFQDFMDKLVRGGQQALPPARPPVIDVQPEPAKEAERA